MKTKHFSKKLALNKKTISNLKKMEMKNAEGRELLTKGTWCPGSCIIEIGAGSGCNSVYPLYCVCKNPFIE